MKEDTVSDVRQEMAERHQAGCLTPGGGRSAKIRADTHMLIGPAKITLRLFLAITQLLRQNVIKVLEFRKKKCHLSKKTQLIAIVPYIFPPCIMAVSTLLLAATGHSD